MTIKTLDEAVVLAAGTIDAVLKTRWDDFALRLIATGCNPDNTNDEDDPPPTVGPWQRLTFEEALQYQKAVDLRWRADTLAKLRIDLAKYFQAGDGERTSE
jgi:hypothetical protein